jgi:hypothetical protein
MGFLDPVWDVLWVVDITAEWDADATFRAEFNFDDFSLCGARIGDPIDLLSRRGLGRAENRRSAGAWDLYYYTRGICITFGEFGIRQFVLVWRDPKIRRFRPYAGKCVHRGQELEIDGRTTPDEIVKIFGEPADRDVHHGKTLALIYRVGDVGLDFDFGDTEQLNAVYIADESEPDEDEHEH